MRGRAELRTRLGGRSDPTEHLKIAAARVVSYFMDKPHAVLQEARRLMLRSSSFFPPSCSHLVHSAGRQAAQSVRSSVSKANVATSALHANAACAQGVLAAASSAAGCPGVRAVGDVLDDDGKILVKHARLTWPLVEVSLGIKFPRLLRWHPLAETKFCFTSTSCVL